MIFNQNDWAILCYLQAIIQSNLVMAKQTLDNKLLNCLLDLFSNLLEYISLNLHTKVVQLCFQNSWPWLCPDLFLCQLIRIINVDTVSLFSIVIWLKYKLFCCGTTFLGKAAPKMSPKITNFKYFSLWIFCECQKL